jgi:hypothetical protein
MDRTDFLTPPRVIDVLRALWPAGVDLDPCGSPRSLVGAQVTVLEPAHAAGLGVTHERLAACAGVLVGDGLALDWAPARTIFVNPPYARAVNGAWAGKIAAEGAAARARGAELVALVRVSTGASHWGSIWTADAVHFPAGRIAFLNPATCEPLGRPDFDVALAYWGTRVAAFADVAGRGLPGATVRPVAEGS